MVGPLAWDDNLDIVIPISHSNTYMDAKDALEQSGLMLGRVYEDHTQKKSHQWAWEQSGKPWTDLGKTADVWVYKVYLAKPDGRRSKIWLDIFVIQEEASGQWHYASPSRKQVWGKEYFTKDPFKNLRDVKFGDLSGISCVPDDEAKDWLNRVYPGWSNNVVLANHAAGHHGTFPIDADERLQGYARRT